MNNNETVPYIFHEAAQARLERVIKRLWITNIILIGIILICFCVLGVVFYYETQFEDVITTETVTQETESGGNNIYQGDYVGGDYYGETNSNTHN